MANDTHVWGQQSWEEIRIPDPRQLRIELVLNPYLSAFTLMFDALGNWNRGVCPQWRAEVRAVAPRQAYAAMYPMVALGRSRLPDCVVAPVPPHRDTSLPEVIERLRDTSGDDLVANLEEIHPGALPQVWSRVADRPARWIGDFADAVQTVGTVLTPRWQAAAQLLDQETQRVGAAAVRGALDTLLASLHPRGRYADGALRLPAIEPGTYDITARRLVLVPMISGAFSIAHDLDNPDVAWISYPVPGLGNLWTGKPPSPPGDQLAELLGPVRAAILRAAGTGLTLTALSERVDRLPSTVTRHADRLIDAGLLRRRRTGKSVLLARTERGTELIDLYARP